MTHPVNSNCASQIFNTMKENSTVTVVAAVALSVITAAALFSLTTPLIASLVTGAVVIGSAILIYNIYQDHVEQTKTSYPKREPIPEIPVKERLNYKLLNQWGITREHIDKYDEDVAKGEYTELKKIVLLLDYSKFKDTAFVEWLFPKMEKMVEEKQLSDEECAKLHQTFVANRLYAPKQSQQGGVNRLALLLASPEFRKNQVDVDPLPLKDYLETNAQVMPKTIDKAFEALKLFKDLGLKEDKKAIYLLGMHPKNNDWDAFFSDLSTLEPYVEADALRKIKDHAVKSWLVSEGVKDPFIPTKGCYTIPVTFIGKLNEQGALSDYLKERVNAVTIRSDQTANQITALRLTNGDKVFEKIKAVVLKGVLGSDGRVPELFPNLESIYFSQNEWSHLPFQTVNLFVERKPHFDLRRVNLDNLSKYKLFLMEPNEGLVDLIEPSEKVMEQLTFVNPSNVRIFSRSYSLHYNCLEGKYPDYQVIKGYASFSGLTSDIRIRDMNSQITFSKKVRQQ